MILKREYGGFSLIELIIGLAILSLVAAIAIPSYQNHMITSRRADGKAALLNLAASLERYYILHHTYEGATFEALGSPEYSQEKFYQLQIARLTPTDFQLAAVPIGPQQHDSACATLTLNHLGERDSQGNEPANECWS